MQAKNQSNLRWFGPTWAIVVLFLVVAAADFAGSFRTSSSIISGDAAMIATRALVGIHPELFRADFLFDQAQNYEFYNNLSVVLFQLVERTGWVSVDLFYRQLKGAATFVHLSGWYLLGRRVLGSWSAALFFSLACTVTVQAMPGDYWGIYREAQPRLLFAAVLPLLILLALDCGQSLLRWIVLFAAAGVAFWLHPASGPPVALSIMLALLVQKAPLTALPSRVGLALVSGTVFLLIIAPNFGVYFRDVGRASEGADSALTQAALHLRFAEQYLDIPLGVSAAIGSLFSGPRAILALATVPAIAYLWRKLKNQERSAVGVLLAILGILILVSCIMPALANAIAAATGRPPIQLDLIRSVRYVIPLLLLLVIWAMVHVPNAVIRSLAAPGVAIIWLLASGFPPSLPQNLAPIQGGICWLRGQLVCADGTDADTRSLIEYVAEQTPEQATIFSPSLGTSIRAETRRPLAFNIKDTGWLAYSNHLKLGESLPAMMRYDEIASQPASEKQSLEWLAFGRDMGADFVVLSGTVPTIENSAIGRVVFETSRGSVVALATEGRETKGL